MSIQGEQDNNTQNNSNTPLTNNAAPKRQKTNKIKNTKVEIVSVPNIDNSETIKANDISKGANKIAFWSNVLSLLLFIITLIVGWISFFQYKSSISASQIAQKTFEITKRYNDSSLAIQQRTFKENNADGIKRNKIDSENSQSAAKSIDAQINTLNETQKEFDIENRPFIQIIDIGFDTLASGKNVVISYNIRNYGKQPVKILNSKIQVIYWYSRGKPPVSNEGYSNQIINSYLGGGVNFGIKTNTMLLTKTDSVAIKNGIRVFYINGIMPFRNVVNNKESKYLYTYKVYYINGKLSADGIRDTTIEIPKKRQNKIK